MRATIALVFLLASAAFVRASALDPTFGGDGETDVTNPFAFSAAQSAAIDAAGSIVATGQSAGSSGNGFTLVRVLADGTPDPAFGTNGLVVIPMPGPSGLPFATRLVLEPDGRIVAAGFGPDYPYVTMIRCLADGSLDPTFGTGGIVSTTALFGAIGLVRDASGYVVTDGGTLARFDFAGALDPTFGVGGLKTLPHGASALARQPDGALVVTSEQPLVPFVDSEVWVGRFDALGSADGAFGVNGAVTTDVTPGFDHADAIAFTSDGRIVVGGWSGNDDFLLRYLPNGVIDPSFGTGGIVVTHMFGPSEIHAVAVDATDRVLAVGVVNPSYPLHLGFPLLRRHLADGSLDPHFPLPDNPFPGGAAFNDVVLQADGKIVTAGSRLLNTFVFHLRRYLPDGFCGNFLVEAGEDCDDPSVEAVCCAPDCTFRPAGSACPDDGDPCTANVCDSAGACLHPIEPDIPFTLCDDGNACSSGDHCVAGVCTGIVIDAGPPCTRCDPATGALTPRPRDDCKGTLAPHASSLRIRFDTSGNARHRLAWQWRKGDGTSLAELGDPINGGLTAFHDFCVFDESGPTPALMLATGAGSNLTAQCATPPCWRRRGSALLFKSEPESFLGASRMTLRPGVAGHARQSVAGKGPELFMPDTLFVPAFTPVPPPYALPLRAQLWARDGACWEATYSQAGLRTNASGTFSARSD